MLARPTVTLTVANTGDRPIQVGSHYHFYEVNPALQFDHEQARGMRLDIPAGTAIRFEPGMSGWCNWWPLVAVAKSMAFAAKSTVRSSRDSKHPVD